MTVLGASSTRFVAPVAQPDAAQAVVGAPVTLQPLANDLPGVDPTNPNARLKLAAPVPAVTGASVATDIATGAVVNGPATEPLKVHEVQEVDGGVRVRA